MNIIKTLAPAEDKYLIKIACTDFHDLNKSQILIKTYQEDIFGWQLGIEFTPPAPHPEYERV